MMFRFARSILQIYMIVNQSIKTVFEKWSHFPRDFKQEWLSPENLQLYMDCIRKNGSPVDSCWDFVDGIAPPIFRQETGQRKVYNGYKKSIL